MRMTENIFMNEFTCIPLNYQQELKYTNSDMRRLRTDLKLELQGQLIVREKEWCKEKENYEALLKKSQATLELERKGSQEMA